MKTIYSIVKNPKYNCITRFSFRERQKQPMKPVNYFCSLINMWAKRALVVPATHHSSRTFPLIDNHVNGERREFIQNCVRKTKSLYKKRISNGNVRNEISTLLKNY